MLFFCGLAHLLLSSRGKSPIDQSIHGGLIRRGAHPLFQKREKSAEEIATLTSLYNIEITEQHPRVNETALKHMSTFNIYQENSFVSGHTVLAFERAKEFVDEFYNNSSDSSRKIVILDSGCGKGMSTLALSKRYPEYPVLGIDRSISRLSRNPLYASTSTSQTESLDEDGSIYSSWTEEASNALLVRADLVDFWMLAVNQSDWTIHSHYMLYPNPYPKSKHLQRRWHGHPVFPVILALGGNLIVRSNWDIYCQEMSSSIRAVVSSNNSHYLPLEMARLCSDSSSYEEEDCSSSSSSSSSSSNSSSNNSNSDSRGSSSLDVRYYIADPPITHFETKYCDVGTPLYELCVNLGLRSLQERQAFIQRLYDAELKGEAWSIKTEEDARSIIEGVL